MTPRERMIEVDLRGRGISDERLLAAMARVPRERFVPEAVTEHAYSDRALRIEEGQTISQPYMVARAIELARVAPYARVLDVGTGSGYQAAVLAELASEVVTIERIAALAESARARLEAWPNVEVVVGDGSLGWPDRAPFDAILAAAATPRMPEAWLAQLSDQGLAVAPVGDRERQLLTVMRRDGTATFHDACVYVPLLGEQGF